MVSGEGGIDVLEPGLWRVGVGVSEMHHGGEIEIRGSRKQDELGGAGCFTGITGGGSGSG